MNSIRVNWQKKGETLRNRRLLPNHVGIPLLCARQGIPIRGHRRDSEFKNTGNFIGMLSYIKERVPDLSVDTARFSKNAHYLILLLIRTSPVPSLFPRIPGAKKPRRRMVRRRETLRRTIVSFRASHATPRSLQSTEL